jgi:hypothetical protein
MTTTSWKIIPAQAGFDLVEPTFAGDKEKRNGKYMPRTVTGLTVTPIVAWRIAYKKETSPGEARPHAWANPITCIGDEPFVYAIRHDGITKNECGDTFTADEDGALVDWFQEQEDDIVASINEEDAAAACVDCGASIN